MDVHPSCCRCRLSVVIVVKEDCLSIELLVLFAIHHHYGHVISKPYCRSYTAASAIVSQHGLLCLLLPRGGTLTTAAAGAATTGTASANVTVLHLIAAIHLLCDPPVGSPETGVVREHLIRHLISPPVRRSRDLL